jgi:hypothetical protein
MTAAAETDDDEDEASGRSGTHSKGVKRQREKSWNSGLFTITFALKRSAYESNASVDWNHVTKMYTTMPV